MLRSTGLWLMAAEPLRAAAETALLGPNLALLATAGDCTRTKLHRCPDFVPSAGRAERIIYPWLSHFSYQFLTNAGQRF